MSNPTPKQKRILDYLKEFIDKHGRPPTLEEIARRFRLRSLSTVHAHLAKLREKGWIARDANTARGFRLTDKALGIRSQLIPVAGDVMPDGAIAENTDNAPTVDVITELAGNEQAFALRIRGTPLPGSRAPRRRPDHRPRKRRPDGPRTGHRRGERQDPPDDERGPRRRRERRRRDTSRSESRRYRDAPDLRTQGSVSRPRTRADLPSLQ